MTQGCCMLALAQRCSSACGPKTPETATLQIHPAQNLACNLGIFDMIHTRPGKVEKFQLIFVGSKSGGAQLKLLHASLPSKKRQTFQ